MLTTHVARYVALRRALGYTLHDASAHLHAFARFAAARGETQVRASTAVAWATEAPSPSARHTRLGRVAQFARFIHAEDPGHEIPPATLFRVPVVRPLPYIYTGEEIAALVAAAGRLRRTYPLRRQVYATLLGLIAATGLRVSEALDLRFDDVRPDGILEIRHAKCGTNRLVPLHLTVQDALDRYLDRRRRRAVPDDHVFLSAGNRRIAASMVNYTFRRVRQLAGITSTRQPRIHDLRHTFATRSLAHCATRREAVGRHVVALATYLGHVDIASTYWYLEATPDLMTQIAAAAEGLIAGEAS